MKKSILLLTFMMFCIVSVCAQSNDVIKSICGVSFGSSMSSAKPILEEKFGECDFSDETSIVFLGISYGGISFDMVMFEFNKNGGKTYLNEANFVNICKTKQEAQDERDRIVEAVSRNYTLETRDGDYGKKYFGGTSPLNSKKYGFGIIVGTSNFDEYPWKAQLQYGPYGYGEEF